MNFKYYTGQIFPHLSFHSCWWSLPLAWPAEPGNLHQSCPEHL